MLYQQGDMLHILWYFGTKFRGKIIFMKYDRAEIMTVGWSVFAVLRRFIEN